jgi:hypothetical protein
MLHATPVRAEVVLGDGQVAVARERRRHVYREVCDSVNSKLFRSRKLRSKEEVRKQTHDDDIGGWNELGPQHKEAIKSDKL